MIDYVVDGVYIGGWRATKFPVQLRDSQILSVLKLYPDEPLWPGDFTVLEHSIEDGAPISATQMQTGVEFISRNDEQVKIRDERVNLGTIERQLRSSRLVLDLALRIELDDLGIPLLTALIVPESPQLGEADLLRSFRQSISTPGHLPHRVVIVNEIAISEHGKHMAAAE